MKYILFTFYKLYTWAERSGRQAPIIAVVLAYGLLSFFNIFSVFALCHAALKIHGYLFFSLAKTKSEFIAIMLGWFAVIYTLLARARVKERAFSPENIARYTQAGYTSRSLILYILISFLTFAVALWVDSPKI
jgi:hypothetical protein